DGQAEWEQRERDRDCGCNRHPLEPTAPDRIDEPDAAGGVDERIDRSWVVRLAAHQEEQEFDGDHHGGGRAELVLPPQPHDAHYHHGYELRTNQEQLLYPVQNRTVSIAAMLKRVRNTVPVVTELPGDVRQQKEDSETEA